MTESLGARLRERREHLKIDLRTIADQSKIKLSILEGLERDDISQWPAGIFRRAYVRTYARALGLDPDTIVREFGERFPDEEPVLTPPAPPAAGFRGLVDSALGSLSRLRRTPLESPAPVVAAPAVLENIPRESPPPPLPPAPDLGLLAALCTDFGRVRSARDVQALLGRAASVLNATGLIVWLWDARAEALRAAVVHGYPEKLTAQLPAIRRDADNATAAAFRSGRPCTVDGGESVNGALALPLLTPGGTSGVLAVELNGPGAPPEPVRQAATIVAALLAQLTGVRAAPAPSATSATTALVS